MGDVLVVMKIQLVVTHRHVPRGPAGSHGQCVRQHVAVDFNDEPAIVETVQHVQEARPKSGDAKQMNVHAGPSGPIGQTVALAAGAVPNASHENVYMAAWVNAVALAQKVSLTRVILKRVHDGQVGAPSQTVARRVVADGKHNTENAWEVYRALNVSAHIKILKRAMKKAVHTGQIGPNGQAVP